MNLQSDFRKSTAISVYIHLLKNEERLGSGEAEHGGAGVGENGGRGHSYGRGGGVGNIDDILGRVSELFHQSS